MPDRPHTEADGEGPDHPPQVPVHVASSDGKEGQHQADAEPDAEHERGPGLRGTTEGDAHAEPDGADSGHQTGGQQNPTQPLVHVVVLAAVPERELQGGAEEVDDARQDMQVGQPGMP